MSTSLKVTIWFVVLNIVLNWDDTQSAKDYSSTEPGVRQRLDAYTLISLFWAHLGTFTSRIERSPLHFDKA
jgi:hypothetical protein